MYMQRIKRISLGLGITLLILSVLMAMVAFSGLVHLPEKLFAGESTVHSVARVAITGCLLAAIGTME